MSRPPPPVPCSPRPHPFSWLSLFSPFSNVKYEVLLRNFPPFLPLSALYSTTSRASRALARLSRRIFSRVSAPCPPPLNNSHFCPLVP